MSDRSQEALLEKARQDADVLAVFLFGSRARGDDAPGSDTDLCVALAARQPDPLSLSRKRLEYLEFDGLDVHVFQQLPLYIRHRVLKEGRVLFVRDEDALYELAFRTVQAFEDFRYRYQEYLEEVAAG